MTNLFAELREDGHLKEFDLAAEPILCDITNVENYVKEHNGESISIDQLVPKLPWEMVWYEFCSKEGAVGSLNISDKEGNINIFVFSKILYKYTPNRPLLGYEKIRHKNGEYFRDVLSFSNDMNVYNDHGKKIVEGLISYASINSLYASTFAHCRNVEYYEKSHPEKLQKANIKRGKIPQETYRILDIEGLTKQCKSESTKERGELQTALHICRGHFRTYTEEAPLFGKITGTVWVPMHKRGSEKNGKVDKDYRINATSN